ncbi:MAG: peptidoglycan editing factor PgeF [Coriobacteriia bacterium]|nr:peptidoglycan editing factor PgeF [Coriobacteriia bacterium]
MIRNTRNRITYFSFENLSQGTAGEHVHHAFSTRLGGVSSGPWSSMNLSGLLGDDPAAVEENFRRFSTLGFPLESMVFSQQTHQCKVLAVGAADRGKGTLRQRDYKGIDGLVTNEPDVVLATFYADCVPLYFVDPVMHAIGLSHAGWRGTVGEIGARTLQSLVENYGSDPHDVLVGIGPSICKECFEVSFDVADAFKSELPWSKDFIAEHPTKIEKSFIDLQGINRQSLIRAGIPAENIELPGICTACNPELFFSHRATGLPRGSLAAFLSLK